MSATIIPFPDPPGIERLELGPDQPAALPDDVRKRLDEIAAILASICIEHLDLPYARVCTQLLADVAHHEPFPMARGRAGIWAGAIVHLVGSRNGLFHAWFGPRLAATDIARLSGASIASINNRSRELRDLLALGDRFNDPRYLIPTLFDMIGQPDALDAIEFAFDTDPAADAREFGARAELLDQTVATLEELQESGEPQARDLAAVLKGHRATLHALHDRAQAELATSPRALSPDLLESVAEATRVAEGDLLAAGELVARATARATARRTLEANQFERVETVAAALAELASVATSELQDPRADPAAEVTEADRQTFVDVLQVLAHGYEWSRRAVHAPLQLEPLLLDVALDSLQDLTALEPPPLDDLPACSPVAEAAAAALQLFGVCWGDTLGRDELELYAHTRDRFTTNLAVLQPHELRDWFDIGVAYAHVERILAARAAADGRTPPRSANPISWLELLDPQRRRTGRSVTAFVPFE